MIIYFARHGQTDSNAAGIIQGQLDTTLNSQGRREAAVLADAVADVPFVEAHSSSLARAKETAEIVVARHPGLELQTHLLLMERGLGSLEGRRWDRRTPLPGDVEPSADFRVRIAKWFKLFLDSHQSVETDAPESRAGETHTRTETQTEAQTETQTQTQTATPPPSGPSTRSSSTVPIQERRILVISHGAYLSGLMQVLPNTFGFNPAPGVSLNSRCYNTSITRVRADYDAEEDKWHGEILSWADVRHLGANGPRLGADDDIARNMRALRETAMR